MLKWFVLLYALPHKLCIANYVYALNIRFNYRYELYVKKKFWKLIPLYTLSLLNVWNLM